MKDSALGVPILGLGALTALGQAAFDGLNGVGVVGLKDDVRIHVADCEE